VVASNCVLHRPADCTRTKLTVRLPEENVEFVKRYAVEHGLTVTDLLDRYLTRLRHPGAGASLRRLGGRPQPPELRSLMAVLPAP